MLQGAIPLDILTKELGEVPLSELEDLVSAATGGKLSIRNKSMTVLGRLRGISCASVRCFLQISKQSSLKLLEAVSRRRHEGTLCQEVTEHQEV